MTEWLHNYGTDADGDRVNEILLVEDCRVLAKIEIPVGQSSVPTYCCYSTLSCGCCQRIYTDIEEAKRWCEFVALEGIQEEIARDAKALKKGKKSIEES